MKKNKLIVFDKDWTLVRPKSGDTFVQHPKDQVPLPGAIAAVSDYVSQGWLVSLASNQAGVATRKVKVGEFPIGAYYLNGNDPPVKVIGRRREGNNVILDCGKRLNGKDYLFFPSPRNEVSFQFKPLSEAIKEMQYCMRLFGITDGGYLCPDEEGKKCWHVWADWPAVGVRSGEPSGALPIHTQDGAREFIGQFRKPDPGMILYQMKWAMIDHRDEILYVGDMPTDEQAAIAAKEKSGRDVKFAWASDFLAPFV